MRVGFIQLLLTWPRPPRTPLPARGSGHRAGGNRRTDRTIRNLVRAAPPPPAAPAGAPPATPPPTPPAKITVGRAAGGIVATASERTGAVAPISRTARQLPAAARASGIGRKSSGVAPRRKPPAIRRKGRSRLRMAAAAAVGLVASESS